MYGKELRCPNIYRKYGKRNLFVLDSELRVIFSIKNMDKVIQKKVTRKKNSLLKAPNNEGLSNKLSQKHAFIF